MVYFHFILFFSSYMIFLIGDFIPQPFRGMLLGVAVMGAIMTLRELYRLEQEAKDREIEELNFIEKEKLLFIEGTFLCETVDYNPMLKQFVLLTIETKDGLYDLYCNIDSVIDTIKYSPKPIRLHYYKNYILNAEILS